MGYMKQLSIAGLEVPVMKPEIKSTIFQQIELTNGAFTFHISCDGEYVKIARKGTTGYSSRGEFFLIPLSMWDEVVTFVYTEGKRRESEDVSE